MKIYYRYTKVDHNGNTIYELDIYYKSYIISLYFGETHLPSKRLAIKYPFKYFSINEKRNKLRICITPKIYPEEPGVELKNPDLKMLGVLIDALKDNFSMAGIKEKTSQEIITEFLKALYTKG